MYAVIESCGKQYKVAEGDVVFFEKLDAEEGKKVTFDKVILVSDEGKVEVGNPYVKGMKVEGKVVSHGKGKKIIVFKMKAVHICPPLSECVNQISNTIFSLLCIEGSRSQLGTEVIAMALNLTDQAKSAGFQTLFFNSPCEGREKTFAELLITIKRACFSTHGVAGSAR